MINGEKGTYLFTSSNTQKCCKVYNRFCFPTVFRNILTIMSAWWKRRYVKHDGGGLTEIKHNNCVIFFSLLCWAYSSEILVAFLLRIYDVFAINWSNRHDVTTMQKKTEHATNRCLSLQKWLCDGSPSVISLLIVPLQCSVLFDWQLDLVCLWCSGYWLKSIDFLLRPSYHQSRLFMTRKRIYPLSIIRYLFAWSYKKKIDW